MLRKSYWVCGYGAFFDIPYMVALTQDAPSNQNSMKLETFLSLFMCSAN